MASLLAEQRPRHLHDPKCNSNDCVEGTCAIAKNHILQLPGEVDKRKGFQQLIAAGPDALAATGEDGKEECHEKNKKKNPKILHGSSR